MVKKQMIFRDQFTSDFLLNSWDILKNNSSLIELKHVRDFIPISRFWFEKNIPFVKKGNYDYYSLIFVKNYKLRLNQKILPLRTIKRLILEISFINALSPLFKKSSFLNLTEYNFYLNSIFKKEFFNLRTLKNFRFNGSLNCYSPEEYFSYEKSSFLFFNNSIHQTLSQIKSWNPEVNFFFSSKFKSFLDNINKNKLKNIFSKYIKDERYWFEIEKMLTSGFLNLSFEFTYFENNFAGFSPLSTFLVNVYLSEFDNFVRSLSYKNNSIFILNNFILDKDNRDYRSFLLRTIPLKLEYNLINIQKLCCLNNLKTSFYKTFFLKNFYKKKFKVFLKKILYVRFLHFFLFGFIASKSFSFQILEKVLCYTKTNLHVYYNQKDLILASNAPITFLGFYIKRLDLLTKKVSVFNSSNKIKHKIFLKIINRLDNKRKKLSKVIVQRFDSEVFLIVKKALGKKNLYLKDLKNIKLWLYIFQLECVRSSQSFKLIQLKENKINFARIFNLLKFNKLNILTDYRRFSFNLYIKKLQISLKSSIIKFLPNINKSVLGVDLFFYSNFVELRKLLEFYYENLYLDLRYSQKFFVSQNLKTFKQKSTLRDLSWVINVNEISNLFNVPFNYSLALLTPINLLLKKLSELNYINLQTLKPISNSKYLFFDDAIILDYCSYHAILLLSLFRCSENFSKVKIMVEYIRQSCLLTLCRKHNKSKDWVYSVYTSDLLSYQNLFFYGNTFPTFKKIHVMKKKFLKTNDFEFLLNEKFLLF
uniref:Maturase-like protein n=1 Tax=Euglena anabaena TaxID=38273 RepID=O98713_EUGAN|nr:maturase-like protein [Euglenaria anabaena]